MISMRHKPFFLPQVSAPADVVVQKLKDEDVDYDYIQINPEELDNLNVSQGFVFSDDVGKTKIDDMKPIWLSSDDTICDGHHRYIRAMTDNVPLKAVRIDLNFKDACRLLNKIQDIYEYEEQQKMEEVVAQDAINAENERNSDGRYSQFLNNLEENNITLQSEKPSKNDKTIIAYRKEPISEKSINGNFFTTTPVDKFDKYQIDFENLLDTEELGVTYKDGQNPVDILSKVWFPNVNFEKLSELHGIEPVNLKYKAIAEKAKTMGYDGIKFNTIIWGLKQ